MDRFPGFPCAQLAALFLLSSAGLTACSAGNGGGSSGSGVEVSFDGAWAGTWTASGATSASDLGSSGALTLQLAQTGTTVSGTGSFSGNPCLGACTVSCQVKDHDMFGWFYAGSVQMMLFGSCPESAHCAGSHHADNLAATYQILDGPCAGQSGVIQLTPVVADGINAPEVGAVYVGEVTLVDPADGNVLWFPVVEGR